MSDEYPPESVYPEGHSPFCYCDCQHPCHEEYDAWVARRQEAAKSKEEQAYAANLPRLARILPMRPKRG